MWPYPIFACLKNGEWVFMKEVYSSEVSFGIYPYGICMALGILACFGFLMYVMWKNKFNEEAIDKILLIGVFGTGFGIFAAALFQSVYNYIANPEGGYNLFGEGMTFIGGLIGGVGSFLAVWWLYIYVIAPRTKIKLLQNNMNAGLTDALPFIPIGIVIAHAFGRFGCFFGGCCYGMPTADLEGVWGLPCSAPDGIHSDVLVMPTQLYEMFFLIALGGIMAFLYFMFKFKYNFAVYASAYGVWRFIIEYFRADERGTLIPGVPLYPSQIWSVVMVFAGIGFIFLQKYLLDKKMKHPELQTESKEDAPALKAAE